MRGDAEAGHGPGPRQPREASSGVGGTKGPMTGEVLGERYRIGKIIGEGGMGTVYVGEHIAIQKKIAIKVLADEFAGERTYRRRFLREARAISQIAHPNVVSVSDFGVTPQGSLFLVMELLRGESLADTLGREGALPWVRAKPILMQICRALAAAHDQGILHRDIKPENCFRIRQDENDDFIKVLDFGLAKIIGNQGSVESSLTASGRVIGTAEYIAPEQIRGEHLDARTDIYSLGILMYELVTGFVPYSGPSYALVLDQHLQARPRGPRELAPHRDVPIELEAAILRALEKDPRMRFSSAHELKDWIKAIPDPPGVVWSAAAAQAMSMPVQGNSPIAPLETPVPAPEHGELSRRRELIYVGVIVALAVVVVGLTIALLSIGLRSPTQ